MIKEVDEAILLDYVKSTPKPTVSMTFKAIFVGIKPAPSAASFSSRGPSAIIPRILKPDIMAPGLRILAAWPSKTPIIQHDVLFSEFNI